MEPLLLTSVMETLDTHSFRMEQERSYTKVNRLSMSRNTLYQMIEMALETIQERTLNLPVISFTISLWTTFTALSHTKILKVTLSMKKECTMKKLSSPVSENGPQLDYSQLLETSVKESSTEKQPKITKITRGPNTAGSETSKTKTLSEKTIG